MSFYPLFQYQNKVDPLQPLTQNIESRWHEPWSEPVRVKIDPRLAIALVASGLFSPVITSNITPGQSYESQWHYAWSEPVRQKPILPAPEQAFFFTEQLPIPALVSGWYPPFSLPVRQARDPKASIALAASGLFSPIFGPFAPGPTFESPWHYPWSEPVRFKPQLLAANQQFFFYGTYKPILVSDMKWYSWLSEPVRFKLGLASYQQQWLSYEPRLLPRPNVTAILSAFEVDTDTALFGINVTNSVIIPVSNGAVSASVSMVESDGGHSLTSLKENI